MDSSEYEQHVTNRINRLKRKTVGTHERIQNTTRGLERVRQELQLEFAQLRAEIEDITTEHEQVIVKAKDIVGKFKHVVKKGELQRLQSRVDRWAPEQYITRNAFKKLVNDSSSR